MFTIKDLEKACLNYTLTDLLKEVSTENLISIICDILCNDIIGIREKILETINIELEYRESDKLLSQKKL